MNAGNVKSQPFTVYNLIHFSFLREKMLFHFLLLLVMSACFSINTKAQDTSVTDSDEEYINSDTDSAQMSEGYDTTGYYFNWKEYPDDPFTEEKINVRVSSDSSIQKFKEDDAFWYVKSIEQFKKNAYRLRYDKKYRNSLQREGLLPPDEQEFTQEQNSNDWFVQPWFINTIWTIIIAIFIAAIAYFLLSNKINLFSRSSAKSGLEEVADEENLFSINYDPLLVKYEEQKNYRLAVRILYLQLLKMLSEKNIITYQPNFTNTHYLQQLYKSDLYKEFVVVTHHYEYIWYGEFAITEASYQKIKTDFLNMKNHVLR